MNSLSNARAGEDLRWKKFESGSGGNVCLVDWMGDDFAIAEAARTSYGHGTRKTSDDRTLLRYLMRHWHSTPFEMAELKFRVKVPMDTWRQWIRHRTASVNEYSTRYSEAIDECEITMPGQWRVQAQNNKQGSSGLLSFDVGEKLTERERELHLLSREIYNERLGLGVAREQARKDLPLSNYTEAYWKVDLHNLFHFLRLRMDPHAQKEIRHFSTVIGEEIIAKLFPDSWEAFVDYRLEATILSRLDTGVLRRMVQGIMCGEEPGLVLFLASQDLSWVDLKRCRERQECFEKMEHLGLILPNVFSQVEL